MEALKHENERLRRDNERFVRIIDSGEWGRGRVAELVQAGQVLKQERDQLAQLMGHLRQDYEAVERAKVAQQEELAALKARMRKKGAANNKMLVKVWPVLKFLGPRRLGCNCKAGDRGAISWIGFLEVLVSLTGLLWTFWYVWASP